MLVAKKNFKSWSLAKQPGIDTIEKCGAACADYLADCAFGFNFNEKIKPKCSFGTSNVVIAAEGYDHYTCGWCVWMDAWISVWKF